MSADLIQLIERLGKPKVLVIGDVMLDRYIWGDAERISQEAPVILLRADKREERLGGASSVATMLVHLQAEVALAGVIGVDSDAEKVRQIVDSLDIDQSALLGDSDRPTTVKERYIGRAQQKHPQQMLRVDFESRHELEATLEAKLIKLVEEQIGSADVVLISDYDKGVCTLRLTQAAIQMARKCRKPVLVDPIRCKPGQSPHPYEKYRGCTSMTPNRLEASLASGLPIHTSDEALYVAETLLQRYEMDVSIITLDKDGMALVECGTASPDLAGVPRFAGTPANRATITDMASGVPQAMAPFSPPVAQRRNIYPTRTRHVYDITGAGDMVLSVLGLALAAGADYPSAVRLANVAGGLEVEKIGVAPVTREEMIADLRHAVAGKQQTDLLAKILPLDRLAQEVEKQRGLKRTIAFTNGCFDLLHAGHVQYLAEAKAQGDILVVGLNSDASVRALKGPTRPLHRQDERALVLAALASVDYITIFDESTPLNLIQKIQPQVLVKGADYRHEDVVGASEVESWGGRVHLAGIRPGCSTTGTILKMLGHDAGEPNVRKVA